MQYSVDAASSKPAVSDDLSLDEDRRMRATTSGKLHIAR
jgi:hypothetical protein